jgi:hypothetical protein
MAEKLTRQAATALLRLSDDATLAKVLASGATPAELAEAQAWAENDEAMLNQGRQLPSGRVAQLVEIIKAREEEEFVEPEPIAPR